MKFRHDASRILVFDLECRPTAWYGGDYVGKSLTAVGWSWLDGNVSTTVLTREMTSTEPLLWDFLTDFESADIVVGHFIRGFDLPLLNAEVESLGWSSISPVLTVDTKSDRLTTLGISESLENLVARYELEHDKIPMSEPRWTEHNLWQTPRSVEWVRTRVSGDVTSTKELYLALQDRLRKPKVWDPAASKLPRYRS
jgi:hypothetical protein